MQILSHSLLFYCILVKRVFFHDHKKIVQIPYFWTWCTVEQYASLCKFDLVNRDVSKFMMQFIVEEIDENTSLEDLQKMMAVALAYRVLVCVYEIICIWGAGGATPGKFLLGLRVVTCDTTVLVQPNRVFVVPASNVSLSSSTVRALNKNLSIAFLFPIFITLLFFQHNRTVYDVVAGTIVVQRRRARWPACVCQNHAKAAPVKHQALSNVLSTFFLMISI